MSLCDIYKETYIRLGNRDLPRANQGYDPARQRDLGPGRPTVAIVSDKARRLIEKLERLWDPRLANIVLKVNYFSGGLSPGHFLAMGTNLLLCELMDYYTVDLWAEGMVDQIKQPKCIFCSSCGFGDLILCAGCRQVLYCSEACQRRHWRSGHSKQCKVLRSVYQMSKLDEARHPYQDEMALVVEIFTVSMKLVLETEHQLYDDNGGCEWLLLEEYKMPPFAKTDLALNLPLMVYHPYFYQSVDWFTPRMTKKRGYLDRWGLPLEFEFEYGNPVDCLQLDMMIHNQGILDGGLPCPQIQFVDKLIERKKKQLEKTRMDAKDSPDFILRIELMNTEPKVWRKFQCPSNIPLFTLADKILTPVMGWVRNFHAYSFVDLSDGAHFGPSQMNTVDTAHIRSSFYNLMDDCDVQLGQIIHKEGDQLVWVYDLGDYWEHIITVEEVVKPTGITIIDGEMSCPPENEKAGWQEDVLAKLPPPDMWNGPCLTPIDKSLKVKLFRTIKTMVNLKESGQYIFAKDCAYDPYHFDIEHHLKMVKDALASNLRPKTEGAKVFSIDVNALVNERLFVVEKNPTPLRHRSGCAPHQTENGMIESVNLKRDQKELALCGNCGSTRNLMMCRGCKQIYYCGEACQRKTWIEGGHQKECNLLNEVHKSIKKEEKADMEGKTSSRKSEDTSEARNVKKKVKDLQSKDMLNNTNQDLSRVALLEIKLKQKGIYFRNENMIKKFKLCSYHFNDEELRSMEEVKSFGQFKKLFNTLYHKYQKVMCVAEELGDSMPIDLEEVQKLTETITCREENKKKHPEEQVDFAESSKECAERWKTMTGKEKKRFNQMEMSDKKRYEAEMRIYRKLNKQKAPNVPKRSMHAFFWFSSEVRAEVKAANPDLSRVDVARELGKQWAQLSDKDKSRYEALAEKDRERYEREKTEYDLKLKNGSNGNAALPRIEKDGYQCPLKINKKCIIISEII